jgi:hypothetical protein
MSPPPHVLVMICSDNKMYEYCKTELSAKLSKQYRCVCIRGRHLHQGKQETQRVLENTVFEFTGNSRFTLVGHGSFGVPMCCLMARKYAKLTDRVILLGRYARPVQRHGVRWLVLLYWSPIVIPWWWWLPSSQNGHVHNRVLVCKQSLMNAKDTTHTILNWWLKLTDGAIEQPGWGSHGGDVGLPLGCRDWSRPRYYCLPAVSQKRQGPSIIVHNSIVPNTNGS